MEARFGSSRFPGKVLEPILGEPMLGRVLERLARARTVDSIVIAMPDTPENDPLAAWAESAAASFFRGSESDVLDRVVGAAGAHAADIIVEVTGDCPLVDPGLVDKVVGDFLIGGADFVSNIHPHTTPIGTDVRVFRASDLAEINRGSSDADDHEHVSLHFWRHPERYRCRNVGTHAGPSIRSPRLTVDTVEDLELVRAIYGALYPESPSFSLSDVLHFLERNADLSEINSHITQRTVK